MTKLKTHVRGAVGRQRSRLQDELGGTMVAWGGCKGLKVLQKGVACATKVSAKPFKPWF